LQRIAARRSERRYMYWFNAENRIGLTHREERKGYAMRVQKVHANSKYEFALLDDEGLAIPLVTDFLGFLSARGCSPNTLVAYAHDLQQPL
jgi:hypothetical protein